MYHLNGEQFQIVLLVDSAGTVKTWNGSPDSRRFVTARTLIAFKKASVKILSPADVESAGIPKESAA